MSVKIDKESLRRALNITGPQTVASYVIFKENGVTKAKNGLTGQIDFSGTDAATVIQSAINALENGGLIFIKSGIYHITSPITYAGSAALRIVGEVAHYDRYFPAELPPSSGTVLFADNVTCFDVGTTVGEGTSKYGPIFMLENVIITGVNPLNEPIGNDTVYTGGAGVLFHYNVKCGLLRNVQVHRKEFGIKISAGANKAIDRIHIDGACLTYNYWGIYNDGYWLTELFLRNIEGYLNQRSLIRVSPTYDLVAYRIDDNASSWNVPSGSDDCPIRITVNADAHLSRVSVIGSKGTTPNPAAALMRIELGNYTYVDLKDILLVGGAYRGLDLYGSALEYHFNLNGFYIGKHPSRTYGFRGSTDSLQEGIRIRNAGTGVIENGEVYAVTKILNQSTSKVIIKNVTTYVTENSGTATIAAGSTYVDVSHGLDITPDINRIKVTPKDNLAGRSFWVSDVTSTTFRINISSSDTVDHSFGWSYE